MFATYAFTKKAAESLRLDNEGVAKIAFGDSSAPATRNQTDLQGDNQIVYPVELYHLDDQAYVSFRFTDDIPFEINEVGLFNKSNEMIFRGTFKSPLKIIDTNKYSQRLVLRLKLGEGP
ncbi:MAG: hypothetical protein DRJ64_09955 [Thermoprotei archaeon]|nr:MAG: hypothetical protein DRJ64_09955 [Thermoprotei archaeon]